MKDDRYIWFVRGKAATAKYIMSVCTGALLLGAAGLLEGYKATTHWLSLDILPTFGAIPVRERWHIDRNRITCGGVTAGIDGSLALASLVYGPQVAKTIQLIAEYAPAAPFAFACGNPDKADTEIVNNIKEGRKDAIQKRAEAAKEIFKRHKMRFF